MKLIILKENANHEKRVAITPRIVEKLKRLKIDVYVEKDIGKTIHVSDKEYEQSGAIISSDRKALLQMADILWQINPLCEDEINYIKKDCLFFSMIDPFSQKDLIEKLKQKQFHCFSLVMLPRSTIAQKMDALSSQANLAGYASVIIAANHFSKILPMMTTPAGTITPSNVFVIGAGVAGLQAIATAKRLGAKVFAYDTRKEVREQIKSLGAIAVEFDIGQTQKTKDGYAKKLTDEQLKSQQDQMKDILKKSDIVITTAQVFGKKAPKIITKEMIKEMKSGSVIVDLATPTGGNVEGTIADTTTNIDDVSIIGLLNFPSFVASSASYLYSSNLFNFLEHFWDKEKNNFNINEQDEIISKCLIKKMGKQNL
jgi:H+-translocating NAD(P) transhydrogenase subunit alpha